MRIFKMTVIFRFLEKTLNKFNISIHWTIKLVRDYYLLLNVCAIQGAVMETQVKKSLPTILLTSIVVSFLAGFASLGFIKIFEFTESQLFSTSIYDMSDTGSVEYLTIIVPLVIGGLLVGLLTHYLMPDHRNVGFAGVLEAVHCRKGMISLREGLGIGIVSAVSLGSGASVGRYGPAVHLCASLGSAIAHRFKFSNEGCLILLSCGVASAIATSFHAPFAGVFFAHELILKHYSIRAFSAVTMSAVIGMIIGEIFRQDHPELTLILNHSPVYSDYLLCIIIGFLSGLFCVLFMKMLMYSQALTGKLKIDNRLKPMVGAFFLAAIFCFYPQSMGVGAWAVQSSSIGELGIQLAIVLLFMKLLATCLSFGFGFNGGVFGPVVFMGAMIGTSVAGIADLNGISINADGLYAVTGMGAMVASLFGAPLSAVIIVLEMTEHFDATTFVLTGVTASYLLTRLYFSPSLFHYQLDKKGIQLTEGQEKQIIRTTPITECMSTEFVCCQLDQTVAEIKKIYSECEDENDIYLVDSNQLFKGRVDMKQLLHAPDSLTGLDILQTDVFKFENTDSIEMAFNRLTDFVGISVPITQDNKLIGITNEGRLIEFYLDSLDEVRNEELGIIKP